MGLKQSFWGAEAFMQGSDSLGLAVMRPTISYMLGLVLNTFLRVIMLLLLVNAVVGRASQ